MPLTFDETLAEELEGLRAAGRLRVPDDGALRRAVEDAARVLGLEPLDASSNDYLGLGGLVVSRETSVQGSLGRPGAARPGAGASRLVHGSWPEHAALEQGLASWVGLPTALLFTSGYAANAGLISALAGPDSLVVSDQLNHASLIDGCRLSRARIEVVPHLDLAPIARALGGHVRGEKYVVVESFFSMDGDGPDLRALRALCDEHNARLLVDEAHALGVFGPEGSGRCRAAGVSPDVLIGTLGKSVGLQGAFVAGSQPLRSLLWNRARSFVFSTAVSPRLADEALFHVERVRSADAARKRLLDTCEHLRSELGRLGVPAQAGSMGPIVPVLLGTDTRALEVAEQLAHQGILAQAIRPPTVPEGTARVRITVSAAWPDGSAERVARAIAGALK